MVQKFSKKFGLDPERKKLDAGIKFTVTQIVSINTSKRVGDNGEPYEIATINGLDVTGNHVKYYTSKSVLVAQCRDMLKDARPDGTLKEPVEVEVIEETSDKNRKYLTFS